ncbi:hypothetical protein FPQ18DRAFT_394214 [Pyronema domesticum]|nr:hypothetical protein FPQ18DRAFT_394214 [Pyronema domesticum]
MHIPRHTPGLSFSGRFSRRHTSSSYSSSNDGDNDDIWSTTATAGGSRSRFSRRQSSSSSSSPSASSTSSKSSTSSSSTSSSDDDSSDDLWSTAATAGRGKKNRKPSPSSPSSDILDYCPVCDSYEPRSGHDPRKAKSQPIMGRRNSLPNTNDGSRKVRFEQETVRREVDRNIYSVPESWPSSVYYLGDPWTIPLSRGNRGTGSRCLPLVERERRVLKERVKECRLYGNGHCECWERVTVNVPGRLRRVRSFWGDGVVKVSVATA